MSDSEWMQLYAEAFGGLLCPFPRLDAMRRQLAQPLDEWTARACAFDREEFARLQAQESEYYRRKAEAKAAWLAEWKRRNGRTE